MIEIRKLQKNNIFYYAGKVYICSWTDSAKSISAMETHSKGKHRYFKPDTKVLFISPSFMKKLMRLHNMKLSGIAKLFMEARNEELCALRKKVATLKKELAQRCDENGSSPIIVRG